jgi:SAM-dependent methyltransferase
MAIDNKYLRWVGKILNALKRQLTIPLSYRFYQLPHYPTIRSVDDFLFENARTRNVRSNAQKTLDIGCGASIRNPFGAGEAFGVDIREDVAHGIVSADLNLYPIPFPDGQFNYVTAFDFLEHVPRVTINEGTRFPFVQLMNEVDRVLCDGGLFFSMTPAYPSKQAFQDPTHVNFITEDTMPLYFCGDGAWARMYGFSGKFELVAQGWYHCWLVVLMRKKR